LQKSRVISKLAKNIQRKGAKTQRNFPFCIFLSLDPEHRKLEQFLLNYRGKKQGKQDRQDIPNVIQKLVFDGVLLCIKIFVFTRALP